VSPGSAGCEAAQARDFSQALSFVQDVPGWLTDAQARRLWDAAARVQVPGRIVEIGSFRGRSTIVLASAASEGVELVAVDPHGGGDRGPREISAEASRGRQDHDAFHSNLKRAGVAGRVIHIREPSREALASVAGQVDLLYIDGAHRYGPARADIEQWGARVAPGGTMLIHDAFNAVGVTLAQARLLVASSQFSYRRRDGSLAEYRREPLAPRRRLGNATRQLAALPYFARNLVVKILIVAKLAPLAALIGHRGTDWPY
jgi:predicted O-methyltransferase YrrM